MKKAIAAAAGAFFYLAASLAGQTNEVSGLDGKIAEYRNKTRSCVSNLSKTNSAKEEVGGFFLESTFILETYEKFRDTLSNADLAKLESDSELSSNVLSIYLKRAERQLDSSEFGTKRPSINSLERALLEYRKAYSLIKNDETEKFVEPAGRIEYGFEKLAIGFDNYAEFHRKDSFMNPEGKEWEFNPSNKLRELEKEVKEKRKYLSEMFACRKGVERAIGSIKNATSSSNSEDALDKMIIGAKWLTTILNKDKGMFVRYFLEFNSASIPAMEVVKKGYNPGKMKEFQRFYEPLKSHYLVLTQPDIKQ